jgi:hypothetical protein
MSKEEMTQERLNIIKSKLYSFFEENNISPSESIRISLFHISSIFSEIESNEEDLYLFLMNGLQIYRKLIEKEKK